MRGFHPDVNPKPGGVMVCHCPVDDGVDVCGTVGMVDDDVPEVPELLVAGGEAGLVGLQLAEPILLHDEDQVIHMHVREHALGLDGDYGRPGPTYQEEEEGDTPHHRNDPEDLPGKGHDGILAPSKALPRPLHPPEDRLPCHRSFRTVVRGIATYTLQIGRIHDFCTFFMKR